MRWTGLGVLAMAACLLLGCGDDAAADREPGSDQVTGDDPSPDDADGGDADPDPDGAGDGGDGLGREAADDDGDVEDDSAGASAEESEDPSVDGLVRSAEGDLPLVGAVVSTGPAGDRVAVTGPDGGFTLDVEPGQLLTVRHPTYLPTTVDPAVDGATITLEPILARGVRVSREVAADPVRYRDLLDQIEGTSVNSLVFDTKDETGEVLYETEVAKAAELDAVRPRYQPAELLAEAAERGLYPITRVVTFEDRIWSSADPEAKLAGAWVDATDQANWAYPIALADEACRLGFAEIQFDYVRYPAGRTAEVAAGRVPPTADERAATIAAFLAEARSQLEPQGCGVSAAIFGIVMSSETDEGIGQTVEAVSAEVDAVSPMLYPSHYGPGWLGFADPNDHPGPVIADALDDGMPRLAEPIQMRPWIQAFYYNGAQIGAQISEAEARGAGWLLWNASGNYRDDWLPEAG